MRWTNRGRSASLDDRRGASGGPVGKAGMGVGGIVVLLVLAFLGKGAIGGGGTGGLDDVLSALPQANAAGQGDGIPEAQDPDRDLVSFVSYVFDDTQTFWTTELKGTDHPYQKARITLFDAPVPSGCGGATPEIGPHYCPPDRHVYLDLGFFRDLSSAKFGAPGDFAQAYVIAHEVGHHVQNLLGTSDEVNQQQQDHPDDANAWSVKLELQADCFAGVWAHGVFERGDIQPGDLKEALGAAESVGDDRLQRQASGRVDRESWTHGSSADRERWFQTGYDSGDPSKCDTF